MCGNLGFVYNPGEKFGHYQNTDYDLMPQVIWKCDKLPFSSEWQIESLRLLGSENHKSDNWIGFLKAGDSLVPKSPVYSQLSDLLGSQNVLLLSLKETAFRQFCAF